MTRTILLLCFLAILPRAWSHSPHDHIEALATSPGYATDKAVFVVVRGNLLRGTNDGKEWKRIVKGLDNREPFTALVVGNQYLYAASKGDGVYRTADSGVSFIKVNEGLTNKTIKHLYAGKDDVYAGTRSEGLFRAEIGNEQWKRVLDIENEITSFTYFPDLPELKFCADAKGQLYISQDTGETWTKHHKFEKKILSIVMPNSDTLLVGTESGGLLVSKGDFTKFEKVKGGIPDESIAYLTKTPDALFASAWSKGVFRSDDDGVTWTDCSNGLTGHGQADDRDLPQFEKVHIPKNPQRIYLAGYNGLFVTENRGKSWSELSTLSLSLMIDLTMSGADESGAYSYMASTYWRGAFLKGSDENEWKPLSASLARLPWEDDGKAGKIHRLHAIRFAPGSRTHLFGGLRDELLISTNAGSRWKKVDLNPLFGKDSIIIDRLVFSNKFTEDQTLFAAGRCGRQSTRRSAVIKSTDGGNSFTPVFEDKGEYAQDMAISPAFHQDGTVFVSMAADFGGKIFRTTDKGKTWQQSDSGVSYSVEGADLAISPGFASDSIVFAATADGLFRSTDKGDSWKEIEDPQFGKDPYIETLAISPDFVKDGTLIVSSKGVGLFKSEDRGGTFKEIAPEMINENQSLSKLWYYSPGSTIVFSPNYARDKTLLGSTGFAMFRSTDGGNSWKRFELRTFADTRFEDAYFYWRTLAYGLGGLVLVSVVTAFLRRRFSKKKTA